MCAIGDIVKPVNVIYASKISKNRICTYLTSKDLATEVTDKYKQIQIQDNIIDIKPLASIYRIVIFSNVASDIPNYVFEKILDDLQVKRSGPVTILKATINKEGYSHVASFCRAAYM